MTTVAELEKFMLLRAQIALDEDDGDLMKKIIMEERFCTTVGTDVGRRGLMHAEACKRSRPKEITCGCEMRQNR